VGPGTWGRARAVGYDAALGLVVLSDSVVAARRWQSRRRYDPGVAMTRVRSIAGIIARVLLGVVAALLLGGAVLLVLAYYTSIEFDVKGLVVAFAAAGVAVFLWTRWR